MLPQLHHYGKQIVIVQIVSKISKYLYRILNRLWHEASVGRLTSKLGEADQGQTVLEKEAAEASKKSSSGEPITSQPDLQPTRHLTADWYVFLHMLKSLHTVDSLKFQSLGGIGCPSPLLHAILQRLSPFLRLADVAALSAIFQPKTWLKNMFSKDLALTDRSVRGSAFSKKLIQAYSRAIT